MAGRPEPVRIDLAHPTFPPEIAELRASVVPLAEALEFTADGVMDAAASETGLEDFGEGGDGFTERLAVVMAALRSLPYWESLEPVPPLAEQDSWPWPSVEQRSVLPDDRTIDVRFDEFMADDVAMIERIYALADQPFDDGVRAAFDKYMARHTRGRHGAVLHDPDQLGLDLDERERALVFYRDRFGV